MVGCQKELSSPSPIWIFRTPAAEGGPSEQRDSPSAHNEIWLPITEQKG